MLTCGRGSVSLERGLSDEVANRGNVRSAGDSVEGKVAAGRNTVADLDDAEANRAAIAIVQSPGSRAFGWLQVGVSLGLLAVTGWFLWQHTRDAWDELQKREFVVDPAWIVLSGLLYAGGMFLLGTPWYLVLQDRQRANLLHAHFSFADVSRVFLISQVGKYVPGKAMVLVIRYRLLGRRGLTLGLAALTSVYETFSTMATGALVASVLLLLGATPALWNTLAQSHWILPLASSLFAVAFVGCVLPPVFSVLPRVTSKLAPAARRHVDSPIAWRTFFQCLAFGVVAWLFLGASFWATVQAVCPTSIGVASIPAMTAVFAFSFVAGFLSMLPGQLLVREAILVAGVLPLIGGNDSNPTPILAAGLSRLITLVVETLMASILYLTLRGSRANLTTGDIDPSPGSARTA